MYVHVHGPHVFSSRRRPRDDTQLLGDNKTLDGQKENTIIVKAGRKAVGCYKVHTGGDGLLADACSRSVPSSQPWF